MKNNFFDPKRALSIARKEFSHIFRDKFTMGMALGLPLIIVFIFGVAIELNMSSIPIAVLDQDHSQSSRQLIETFSSSSYFKTHNLTQMNEVLKNLESEQNKAALVIPFHFEKDLLSGKTANVQVLVNGADNQAAGSVIAYVAEIQSLANKKILSSFQSPFLQNSRISLESRFLYNPELNSKWFNVPGLMVIILAMVAILLTALTVAKEWESGSMELLLSTPVKPLEIIVGKISPYAVICLIAVVMTYTCARLFFGVPFRGSLFTYSLGCILFLVTYLSQGLMISVVTRKQMLAMQFAMISGLIPSMLLSGFIFPIENMPTFFRYFTYILPARWFIQISRASFLQESTLWQLKQPFVVLFCLMIFFIFVAFKKFKKDLEP